MKNIVTLIFLLCASVDLAAWDPIGDLNRDVLKAVGRAADKAQKEAGNSVNDIAKEIERSVGAEKLQKATTICQNECSVCFDGVECDFSCVEKVCLNN